MNDAQAAKVPVLFWLVGGLSLLWNAFGAYDYFMTVTRNAGYVAMLPPEKIQLIDAFPVWVSAAWACGVWGAVAGSVLLLLRSRFAIHAFGISLVGLAANTFYQFGLNVPESAKTTGMNSMTLIIWIVAVLLLLYSIRWRKEGLLR